MLEQAEREKYEKAWALDKYREYSPGEHLVERAITDLGMVPPASVIDFGCGTGRPAKLFQDAGFTVAGVDIAQNCLEVDIPFIQACLWCLPSIGADWGFCTDVMEHIPPERVQRVIQQIAMSVSNAAFFQIALNRDSFGDRIGERLHLTIQPTEWWVEQLSAQWTHVRAVERGNTMIATARNG